MHHIFQRFVERLNDSYEANSFRKAMSEAVLAFELPCFAYLRMPRDDRTAVTLISTYPTGWTDHYLSQHYENLDPVVRMTHDRTEPFEWGLGADYFVLTDGQKALFDEASAFGIRCGFTIPIRDRRGPVAAVTFASDSRRPEFQRSIEANGRVLQLMAISLHAHIRRKLSRDPILGGVELKQQELQCLEWAAAGKTAWETGKILGISERTVNFHRANVRAKLGVNSLRQAVALYAAEQVQRH